MPPRVRTTPRKRAQQGRSLATVDNILAAAARVLVTVGYDHASTKRIAKEAGVSVGSLYQYFPTKEAVVAELMDRHIATVEQMLEREVVTLSAAHPADAIRALVTAFFRAQHVDPKLRRVFVEQVPRIGRLDGLQRVEAAAVELARGYLRARRVHFARRDLDLAAVVVVRAAAALTYQALIDPAGAAESDWIAHITELIASYLGVTRVA
jgi:AcrR family transcriptional regulator